MKKFSPGYGEVSQLRVGIDNYWKDISDKHIAQAQSNYVAETDAQTKESMQEIYANNSDNPERLQQELNSYQTGYLKKVPGMFRDTMINKFAIENKAMVSKSVEAKGKRLDSDAEVTNELDFNQSKNLMMMSAVDLTNPNIAIAGVASENVSLQFANMTRNINALKQDGTYMFTPEQRVNKIREARNSLFETAVTDWASGQGNKLSALQNIENLEMFVPTLDGKMERLKIKDAVNPEEMDMLRKKVSQRIGEEARLFNDVETQKEKQAKVINNQLSKQMFLTDDPVEKQRLYKELSISAYTTDDELIKYKKRLYGADEIDNERNVLQAEMDIINGSVGDMNQLLSYDDVSTNTIRTRLIPKLEAKQNKDYQLAESYIKNTLGLPSGGFVLNENSERVKRVGEALSALILEKEKNPTADYMELAKKIASDYNVERKAKEARDTEARIMNLTAKKDEAMRKGNKNEAERLQKQIDSLTGE